MAEFTPSKKTAQDFNGGIKYINEEEGITGDAVQADTINGLVESALYTQEQADKAVTTANGATTTANQAKTTADSLDAQIKTANETANNANNTANNALQKIEEVIDAGFDPNGDYPNVTVGGATNDGDGRSISDTANKNLYNLGAFDTYASNGDGTATITRRTGYQNLSAILLEVGYYRNTIGYNAEFGSGDIAIQDIVSNYTVDDFVTNYLPSISDDQAYGGAKGCSIRWICIPELTSEEEYKTYLSSHPLLLQYKLATPYIETVIENQPIHTLNQDGEQWVRKEWGKGLNLLDFDQINTLTMGGTDNVDYSNKTITLNSTSNDNYSEIWSGEVDGGYYTFSVKANNPNIAVAVFYDNTVQFGEKSVTFLLGAKQTIRLRIDNRMGNGSSTTFSNLMLNKGMVAFPYQPYNGGIVREKDLSEKTSPPLYAHYFHVGDDVNFAILSPNPNRLTNEEVLNALPANTGSYYSAFGIPASGSFEYNSQYYNVRKVFKRNNQLYAFGTLTPSGAGYDYPITNDLSNADRQQVIKIS